jgi:chaperonin GroES
MNNLASSTAEVGDNQTFIVSADKVLIRCEEDKDTFDSSIKLFKPDQFKRYSRIGKVVQIGDEIDKSKYPDELIGIGDRVCYDAYSGTDIKLNDIDYKVLSPDDIQAKIDN